MIKDILFDMKIILEDITKSGLASVNASVLSRLSEMSDIYEQYGLDFGSKKAKYIADTLEKQRHGNTEGNEELISSFYELIQYNNLCIKKFTNDKLKEDMKRKGDFIC